MLNFAADFDAIHTERNSQNSTKNEKWFREREGEERERESNQDKRKKGPDTISWFKHER